MSQLPPPLPAAESVAVAPPPLPPSNHFPAFESARIPGTEGMSNEEIAKEIFEGGRFVCYPWCVSFLIVTLRRASSVRFLRKNEDGFAAALGYSLISLMFGWWGFPWGLIYTPLSIFNSAKGGKDVTQELLNQFSGSSAASQMLRGAPKRRRSLRMWLLPVILFGGLFLLPLGVLVTGAREASLRTHDPRYAAFEAADHFVSVHRDANASGNTPEAKQIAEKISTQMKTMREAMFTQSKRKSTFSMTDGEFLTWCEIRDKQVVVLVHVPDLRKFDSEGKETLADLAWMLAGANLSRAGFSDGSTNLAVATRGAVLYDRLLTGTVRAVKDDEKPAEPSEKITDSSKIRQRLQELLASESAVAGQQAM